jgi:DNA polymerase V
MDTLRILAPSVEVYSVDESFLDLTGIPHEQLHDYAVHLKKTTEQWTGIPVSIGIAPTKVLSKIANRLAKKDKIGTGGVVILHDETTRHEALSCMPVEDVWGVGRASAQKLHLFNIHTALELSKMSEEWARKNLGGVVGVRLIKELNGMPCIDMKDPLTSKRMVTTTRMFGKPVWTLTELKEAVATYITRASEKLRRQKSATGFMHLFVVESDARRSNAYAPSSRSASMRLPVATNITSTLIAYAMPIVEKLFEEGNRYIKAGILFSDIVPEENIQFSLFDAPNSAKEKKLMAAIDNINFSMRNDVLKFAAAGLRKNWKMRQEKRSPRYTTRWDELYRVS